MSPQRGQCNYNYEFWTIIVCSGLKIVKLEILVINIWLWNGNPLKSGEGLTIAFSFVQVNGLLPWSLEEYYQVSIPSQDCPSNIHIGCLFYTSMYFWTSYLVFNFEQHKLKPNGLFRWPTWESEDKGPMEPSKLIG